MATSMVTRDPLHTKPAFYGTPAEVAPDVFMYPMFVNSYALRTSGGLALVDPGFADASEGLRKAVRAWSDAPLAVAVYTHGHADHAFGLRAFLAAGERPDIIAQEKKIQKMLRESQAKKESMLALMQYLHINTSKIRNGDEEVESLVEDQVLLDVLKEAESRISFLFAKTTG